MVQTLVLVRHGDAERRGPEGDRSRRLTPGGLETLQKTYPRAFAPLRGVAGLELWSSPAVRALQTAEVVADALGVDRADIRQIPCLYDQDDRAFLDELEACPAQTLVAVGHVPFMRDLAARLAQASGPFPKGQVMAVSWDEGRPWPCGGRVLWTVTP
ncbi:histidine phosphatase family protein [Olsenella sp. HMSC062G07]|uniref:SixA phosphatase family protein n=1 Tax=Olsenella sp. HMSC062G07 TaxID=1739330 RepID=UPI0008A2F482|nr:histidine phosphatase family protein [Olsenella sp. HMSC062G07]OFK22282.1 hypothetical protein HMPREF2826_01905 [Olsenella sp. HMSC062G07]